ncbi:MAG: hypothetical protein AB7I36_17165 [Rhodospirillaceae bacterium]
MALAILCGTSICGSAQEAKTRKLPAPEMGFFVTSVGSGRGGDLGGIAGADRHCQELAEKAGAGNRIWHAYLSANPTATSPAVNAISRIGEGPWANAAGEVIARNTWELHDDVLNTIAYDSALTEKGERLDPKAHSIMTGTLPSGKAFQAGGTATCDNWTSSDKGAVQVGHMDRKGDRALPAPNSWNSARQINSCSPTGLSEAESLGLFYCFAQGLKK